MSPEALEEVIVYARHDCTCSLLHASGSLLEYNTAEQSTGLSAVAHNSRHCSKALCGVSFGSPPNMHGWHGSLPAVYIAVCRESCSVHRVIAVCMTDGMQVNCGTWDDLMAASPAALMQLLQLWFQSFQEPILSISQQKAISCIPAQYIGSNTGTAANVQFSPYMQAAGHAAPDKAELSATQDASLSQQQHAELCAAVAEHLSVPQKALIARLVKCFRALAGNQAEDNTVYPLMQWLASALTVPQRQLGGLKDDLTAEQTALVFLFTHCDISLLLPRTTGWCEMMPHADAVADVIQITDDSTKPCVGASLHGAIFQKPCLVATEEQCQMPQDSHEQHADGGPQKMPSRDSGWDADEQGCLWLHSRLAKKALAKFVTLSGRTGAAAQ